MSLAGSVLVVSTDLSRIRVACLHWPLKLKHPSRKKRHERRVCSVLFKCLFSLLMKWVDADKFHSMTSRDKMATDSDTLFT